MWFILGFLRPYDVSRKEDSAIILKRLKQLGRNPLYSNSVEEQKELLKQFSQQKKNQEFLPKSLVMMDAPSSRNVPERVWQYRRITLVTIEKVDFRQNIPLFVVRNLDGSIVKGHYYRFVLQNYNQKTKIYIFFSFLEINYIQ